LSRDVVKINSSRCLYREGGTSRRAEIRLAKSGQLYNVEIAHNSCKVEETDDDGAEPLSARDVGSADAAACSRIDVAIARF